MNTPPDDRPSSGSNDRPRAPTAHPSQNAMSFVAFDGNPSDASRKAVRKQAALASAAARKATIAKKAAKQKEQREQKTQLDALPASAVKRKRPAPAEWSAQDKSKDISTRVDDAGDIQHRKRPQPRMVSAYLSPPAVVTDNPVEQWTLQEPLERSPSPSQAVLTLLAEAIPRSYSRQIMPIKAKGWSVLSEDYAQNEESHLPPTPESLASPGMLAASKMDPFNNYPVEYHPIYDRLLHHMLTIFAPRGWPSLRITNAEGLAWEHFMTQHALAEPALFLVRVLFASGDLVRLKVLDFKVSVALRSLAIKAINDALNDPSRSISDGLILAVGRIALGESLYGDRQVATVIHRPAQRRMIDLRGGIGALPFPPLVKRLMRWGDNVMSMQSNTPRLLPDDEDEGNKPFNIEQSVSVLEDWVPQEGKAMRKKIAIADLIT